MASHNDNPIGYAWQTVVPAAPAGGLKIAPKIVLGLVKSPLKTTLIGARTLIPAGLAGYGVSAATDAVSEATTGKSLEENVSPYTGRTLVSLQIPAHG